jgi:hypothetical protein
MAALDAHNVAEAFLEAAVDSLNTLTADDLAGAPDRQYVATGIPVIDCEQAVVWISKISETNAREDEIGELGIGARGRTGRVNFVTMTVMVARCIPVAAENKSGRVFAPTVEALAAASEQTDADAWVLWCGLNAARRDARIADVCDAVAFGDGTALTPSGGFGGWQIPISVQLQGYRVDLGS